MRLGDETVVAGDPIAFGDFREVAQDVRDTPQFAGQGLTRSQAAIGSPMPGVFILTV